MTQKQHPKLVRVIAQPFNFIQGKCFRSLPDQSLVCEGPFQLTEQNATNVRSRNSADPLMEERQI